MFHLSEKAEPDPSYREQRSLFQMTVRSSSPIAATKVEFSNTSMVAHSRGRLELEGVAQ